MLRPQVQSISSRLDHDPDVSGRGVVIGFVDSGFYPHPDLMHPVRRIKAYADATTDHPKGPEFFQPQPWTWHGTMTACCAAGNGYVSGGHYRGLAPEAEVVLIKASVDGGRILGQHVAHAIRFPLRHPHLGIRVLNVSLGTRTDDPHAGDVLAAVREVVAAGITVICAAGNAWGRAPTPPASSADAITVGGGVNDRGTRSKGDDGSLYPSSHGVVSGVSKPDLLAPAIWVPAPMLPGTLTAREAQPLFQLLSVLEEVTVEHGFSETRQGGTPEERESVKALLEAVHARILRAKYLSPEYQHVDGTSFASPITAAVAAQMLEVCPTLQPHDVRRGLLETAQPVASVEAHVQGAGLLRPREAVAWARRFAPTSSR
jgi:serine protease AprX